MADVDQACAVVRAGGGRVSAARRSILEVLFATHPPISAEEIAGAVDPPLDVPATYRNLERLGAVGLVRHVHLGHGPGRYELVGPRDREYAYCDGCGTVMPIGPEALRILRGQIAATIGIRPSFTHFPLVGRCRERCDEGHP